MHFEAGPLLQQINSPEDLKKVSREKLHQVCDELRQYIIDVVSVQGGHFASSLGVVELSVALHYVYNTPYDQLVWDVGHQAYGHKILTGRRDNFSTNRKYKGLSGFPKRSESEYDTFGVGHSSTSISAALTAITAASASTAISSTFATTALTSNTASSLSTPQTIFGFPFDGSAALSGVISPSFGGTGINNGNKTITLGLLS